MNDYDLATEALDEAFKSKIEGIFQIYFVNALADQDDAHIKFMAGLRLAKKMHTDAIRDLSEVIP